MSWNIVIELNNFLVNRFNIRILFMLYYGRNIEIIFFILINKWLRSWHGIFTRYKIVILIIHHEQTFPLYKTSMGEN